MDRVANLHRARLTHANIFSRVCQGPDKGFQVTLSQRFSSFLILSSSRAHVMSHILLDPFPLLVYTQHSDLFLSALPSEQDTSLWCITIRTLVWPLWRTVSAHILKVAKIWLQLFLLQESRKLPVCVEHLLLTTSQIMPDQEHLSENLVDMRSYERPFAFFVISRPLAHVRWAPPTT